MTKNKSNDPIKLLIVDDSSFMRKTLKDILSQEKDIDIVGEAENGKIAVDLVEKLEPTMITMDLEMPEMNGFEAIESILNQHDVPIIVVSSLTQEGTEATYRALKLGAVDYISKSSPYAQIDVNQIKLQLVEKIRFWQQKGTQSINYMTEVDQIVQQKSEFKYNDHLLRPANINNQFDVIVIAGSTGSPTQLPDLLKYLELDKINCPIIIAVHIPNDFTNELVGMVKNVLNCEDHQVVAGKDGLTLQPNQIIIAQGGLSTTIEKSKDALILKVEDRQDAPIQPWLDLLFKSISKNANAPIGIILSGLDADSVNGAKDFIKIHAPILVQEPTTCYADNLPKKMILSGIASEVLTIEAIGQRLIELTK